MQKKTYFYVAVKIVCVLLSGCGISDDSVQDGDYNISVENLKETGEILGEIEPTEDITSMNETESAHAPEYAMSLS